jgi:5-methyltetrahydropteroyltriglutamate--homocysteine methyltransferase
MRPAIVAPAKPPGGVHRRPETSHGHRRQFPRNDIMAAIAAMDADAISIETTRSRMELLAAFAPPEAGGIGAYPAEIGPGIWDIHSPRVPSTDEMANLLALARRRLADWQIWVNPDCGLKTRSWDEVRPALRSLVEAARRLRGSASA